jgi:hypothetical protein
MNTENNTVSVWKMLRYSYGVVILLAGLDKVLGTNLITDWAKYTSPFVSNIIPLNAHTFVLIIGIIEVLAAVLIFTKFNRLAFYIAALWLVLIAINILMLGGYNDIAVRDLLLAIGALATAKLAGINGYGLYGPIGRA